MFLRVSDGVFAGTDVPLAPRRNDLQVRRNSFVGQFESHLIIALAGAAVRKAIGAEFQRDFRLALGDDRASHGGAEQVGVLIDRAGAQGGPDVITDKFFAEIFDVRGGGAG